LIRDKEWRYQRWHLILLAKNLAGWHNLIRLTSAAYNEGFYQSPCISPVLEEKYREGLICTTACILGPLGFLIQNGTDKQVDEWVERALKIYGDDLYFAIHPHDFDNQRQHNLAIVSLAAKWGRPVIHEKDSHYPEKGWVDTQKIAILTSMNKTFADAEAENKRRIEAGDEVYELWHPNLHISSEQEDREMYARCHPDLPANVIDEAMQSTEDVLNKIEPYLMDRTLKMPRAKGKSGLDAKSQMLKWCREGMKRIGREGDEVYEQRLIYEAEVISAQNAWEMFLLVADAVRWARSDEPLPPTDEDPAPLRKRPIRLNSGRGSAAGSVVCYLSKITMLDPIAHRFKFERFLNPERKSMPDIDIDVASSGHRTIKEYVSRKYGREAVADVVAYQHFQPRAALKNVTHTIHGYDSDAFKEVARLTHDEAGVIDAVNDTDLTKIREREPDLDAWAKRWPEAWEHARRLENAGDPSVTRLSKHAGAVAILPGLVTDVMPTLRTSEEEKTFRTAWAETTRISVVDEIGIVKVDFLALKGMDQQQMVVDAIAANSGDEIDLDNLPVTRDPHAVEPAVMDSFRSATTLGVNQLQGYGIRDFLKRVVPQNLIDLSAVNALYRPGPLGSGGHNRYVKRKNGIERADIPEILVPILGDTYGSIAFQEQVMELFEVLVGYSAGQADEVRKIIAKLYRDKGGLAEDKLREREHEFILAATEKVGDEIAKGLWQEILPYSGYSFNRAHAGSYVVQAYQDMWLKVHYPLDFYSVLLTLEEKKTMMILREVRDREISILPPDVNISGGTFTADAEAKAIRFGLLGVKGLGNAVSEQILADRPFTSLEDFTLRSSRKYSKVNKKAREILLSVGALDCFGARDSWTEKDRAIAELKLLGVAFESKGILGEDAGIVRENIYAEQEIVTAEDGDSAIVAGTVMEIKAFKIKRGKNVGREGANLVLGLDFDQYRLTCWPETWDEYKGLLQIGQMVIAKGRVDSSAKVIVRSAMDLHEFVSEMKSAQVAA
jgi:DNA polymerase-3 subunit alpha